MYMYMHRVFSHLTTLNKCLTPSQLLHVLNIPASGQRSHVSDMHIPVPLQERVPLTKGCQCMVFVAQNVYMFRMSHT